MKKSDISTPIINVLKTKTNYDIMNNNYLKLMKARPINVSSLQWHKKKLGKHKYCWTSFIKRYVWEFENYRVYVSKEGVSFEVLESLSADQALDAWSDYYLRLTS
jgi:hypothetical protein